MTALPWLATQFGKSVHRNLFYLLKRTKDQLLFIAVDWKVFMWSHWTIGWPLPLPWICLLWFLPGLFCHPTAGPQRQWLCLKRSMLKWCFPTYLKASQAEFAMAQLDKKAVGVPGISFLLGVKCIHILHFAPLQHSCTYPFSPLSSAHQFCLYITSNWQFQQYPVWFCCSILQIFQAVVRTRNRNSWYILLLHLCQNKFPWWPAQGSRKVVYP